MDLLLMLALIGFSVFLFNKGLQEKGKDVITKSIKIRFFGVEIMCLMVVIGMIIHKFS
ncbi:hypothetical protein LV85_00070 [Algoriphagus chordae]|uniref:Uncharacterized protein n=1 Tax=Algoriphagus chordae TaxID=237019 RepID=A0A2W7RAB4_9BACT|nr:hypothetical protein LV85_00070 [Algoriphagus chordae]